MSWWEGVLIHKQVLWFTDVPSVLRGLTTPGLSHVYIPSVGNAWTVICSQRMYNLENSSVVLFVKVNFLILLFCRNWRKIPRDEHTASPTFGQSYQLREQNLNIIQKHQCNSVCCHTDNVFQIKKNTTVIM